jgi:hypothetical protein
LELELEAMGTAAADNHDQAPLLQAQPEEIPFKSTGENLLNLGFFYFFSMAIISSLMGNYILIYV